MTTIKDLAAEYVDTYLGGKRSYDEGGEPDEAYNDMVFNLKHDVNTEFPDTDGVPITDDTELADDQVEYLRGEFAVYAEEEEA